MRNIILEVPKDIYDEILQHLSPIRSGEEESAFLFAIAINKRDETVLKYLDWYRVEAEDYDSRSEYHLELSDTIRPMIIKKAHDLSACIIEFHSHVKQESATFSFSDWLGFQEFVPHVFWRLNAKPYGAVVTTRTNFDALIWLENPITPVKLDGILVNGELLKPTNNSINKNHGFREI